MHINFSRCHCKTESKRDGEKKRNSGGSAHGIANHSSAEAKPARFRERQCHPISTNERLGRRQMYRRGGREGRREKVGGRGRAREKTE